MEESSPYRLAYFFGGITDNTMGARYFPDSNIFEVGLGNENTYGVPFFPQLRKVGFSTSGEWEKVACEGYNDPEYPCPYPEQIGTPVGGSIAPFNFTATVIY